MAVTSFRVTGDWRHVIDDGMVDEDALPDEALPTGHVVFTPISPSVAVDGAPAIAHTLAEVKALISAGELNDLQGREGVYLVGKIGGITVRWRAVTHLYFQGVKVDYPPLVFDLTEDARLTGLIQNSVPGEPPMVIDPRIEALIEDAQEVLADAQAAIAGLEASEQGASEARDEAVQAALDAAISEGNAEQFAVDAESSASAASGSATASAGSAASAAGSAGTAETARTQAETEANRAQGYADDFDLTVSGTSTGAPGSNANVTVTGDGPDYALSFTIPRGAPGDKGAAGLQEVAWTDEGRPYLLDVPPATQGDSGWRTIDTKNNSGGNPNRLDMRRVGGTCYARVFGQPGWANSETITFTGTPDGFKHELGRFHDNAYGCSAPIVTNLGNGAPTDCGRIGYRLWVSEEIQVRITNNGSRYWVAELSWLTSDEWPETLPGTAAE